MKNINKVINQSSSLKLLYVEDNELARESTIEVFEEFFKEIIIAVDGEDGYSKFGENRVDIIITDINMPKLNGIDMIKKIRIIDNDVPILILSAHNESGYFIDSIKLGVDGYLLKPIDMDQLLSILDKVTKKINLAQDLKSALSLSAQYQEATDKSSIVSKTDLKGMITYVNDEFCRISEYSREELIGESHNIIRHPDNPSDIYIDLWQTIQKKQIWQKIIRNISKNGNSYYVKTTIKPILDLNGEIIEYIALRDDITEVMSQNKQLEYFIKYANNSMLFMMEIANYDNLRNFYGHLKIVQIEEGIGRQLLESFLECCNFEKIFILGSGMFAIVKDKANIDIENITIIIESLLNKINNSSMKVNDTIYDISIRMAISYGENILENCTYGLEQLRESEQDFFIANNLANAQQEKAKNNLHTLDIVNSAIKSDKIVSYFQPIIDNKTKKIVKYESLVRLIDEDANVLVPYYFLDTTKQGRCYSQITQIVLQNSFNALYHTDKSISINLSALDIEKEGISNFIFELLEKYKENTHRIIFELLEDENIKDINIVKTFIQRVKKYNVLIAIDDFGAGYSNFERLLDYQPDILKIDGSLIKNILTNQYSLNVVKTIITFAKSQNIKIIAEFVENEAIYNLLNELDVDYSQGYYFGEAETLPIMER